MRVAYCEDEPIQADAVRKLLEEWQIRTGEVCTLTLYQSAKEMLFENGTEYPFDFLLLDICMDEIDGLKLAREIRKVNKKIPIAFLSSRKDFVFEGYEVQAVRYLLKPIRTEDFFSVLDFVRQQREKEHRYLIVTSNGERVRIEIEEIRYIEAVGHYLHIHIDKDEIELKKSLTKVTKELDMPEIIAVHRSFLINLRYLKRITRTECVLEDGITIPLARNRYKIVNQAFLSYYMEKNKIYQRKEFI